MQTVGNTEEMQCSSLQCPGLILHAGGPFFSGREHVSAPARPSRGGDLISGRASLRHEPGGIDNELPGHFIRGCQPHSWKVRHCGIADAHNTALCLQWTIPRQVTEPFNESAVAAVIRNQLGDRVARMKVAALAMNAERIEPPGEIGKRECSIAWHLNVTAAVIETPAGSGDFDRTLSP